MSFRNKPRRKRSPIWTVDKKTLTVIVEQSTSIAEILRKIEVYTGGGNRNSLMKRLQAEQIDVSHISMGLDSNKGRKFGQHKSALSFDKIFTEKSTTTRAVVKRRILKDKLLPFECQECGLKDQWNEKPIMLVLDHVNGIPNDHRLDNLRFLCPNCNSQTETFCGRNFK